MSCKTVILVGYTIAAGLLVPAGGYAVSVNFCADWKSEFVDAGHGEDHYYTTSPTFRDAKYAHYQVVKVSTGDAVHSGILDNSGCTGYLSLEGSTQYKFRQATKLERTGNRKIYAEFPGASWGPYFWWVNTYYTTPSTGSIVRNIHPDWLDPAFNVSVVDGKVLQYYSTRE